MSMIVLLNIHYHYRRINVSMGLDLCSGLLLKIEDLRFTLVASKSSPAKWHVFVLLIDLVLLGKVSYMDRENGESD